MNELDQAEQDYKKILDSYITSNAANSALLGLQNTFKLNNKDLEFESYLTRYKEAHPENQTLENIELESAVIYTSAKIMKRLLVHLKPTKRTTLKVL